MTSHDLLPASPAVPPVGFAWHRPQVPVALAAVAIACAGLPLFDHPGALQLAGFAGVTAAAIVAAALLIASRARGRPATVSVPSEEQAPVGQTDDASHLPDLLVQVLPIWKQQVEAVRTQTEQAINALVASFSSISDQFELAGFQGAGKVNAIDEASLTLLTLCQRQLTPVITSMHSLMEGKEALASSVKDLAMATLELQGMASSVSQIAAQTNMLAINAAIEAARAGDSGRGFAVIAKEIRNLSQVSAQTGKQITERMAQVTKIMKTTVDTAALAAVHDKTAIEMSGGVVEDVLGHVRELGAKAEAMRGQGNVIRNDIESLLVSLQFQDRVSQIITVIDTDIARLQTTIEGGGPIPEPDAWLETLQSSYTMDDQRRIQVRVAANEAAHGDDTPATSVDFF